MIKLVWLELTVTNNNLNLFFWPNLFVPVEDIIGFSELKEGTLLQDFPCIYW